MSRLASPAKMLIGALLIAFAAGCSSGFWHERDHGSMSESSGDAALTRQVQEALLNTEQLRQADIRVSTTQGIVTLSGVADSIPIERKALEVARSVPGVRQVRSSMIVQGNRTSSQQSIAPTAPHQGVTARGVQMHHSEEDRMRTPQQ